MTESISKVTRGNSQMLHSIDDLGKMVNIAYVSDQEDEAEDSDGGSMFTEEEK